MRGERTDTSRSRMPQDRVCVVCNASLIGHRPHARHCGGPCRAEAARIRGILSGKEPSGFRSLKARLESAQRGRLSFCWAASPSVRPQLSTEQISDSRVA